jgi:hypothetical protein
LVDDPASSSANRQRPRPTAQNKWCLPAASPRKKTR